MPGNIRTAEEKYNIIMEALSTTISITELCRKYGISPSQFYRWKEQFLEGAKNGLAGQGTNNSYEKEIRDLKGIIGEITIANEILKKTVRERKR